MKRKFLILFFFATLLLVGLLATMWWNTASQAVSSDGAAKRVLVTKGTSAVEVGNLLYEENIIKSPLAFKIYIQVKGYSSRIQAGEYELPQNLTLAQTVAQLLSGPSEVWVTIPEGLRREEIPSRFIAVVGLTGNQAITFQSEFLVASVGEEGFLFPDTYLVPKDVTGTKVFDLMRNTFDLRFDADMKMLAQESDYSLSELVTLASIVERETRSAAERPVVAGIYFNRLEIGMSLQADATVQYALASIRCQAQSADCAWWEAPTRAGLQVDSPYNTYKYSGLPPGPIASPGLSALEAVVKPTASDYLYYIHDPKGNIHYAETLTQHNANVQQYLR